MKYLKMRIKEQVGEQGTLRGGGAGYIVRVENLGFALNPPLETFRNCTTRSISYYGPWDYTKAQNNYADS